MTERKSDQSRQPASDFASTSVDDKNADGLTNQLSNKVILIIGLASEGSCNLAVLLAEMGSDIAIVYSSDAYEAAKSVSERVEALGQRCLAIMNNSGSYLAQEVIQQVITVFGRLDVFISYPLQSGVNQPSSVNGFKANGTGQRELRYLYRSIVFPNFAFMKAALDQIIIQ
ncbi:MAG TPA: hypothetical protein VF177_23675 [Anaerolineae bacterium]